MDKIRAIFKTIRNWRLQTILILTYVILITVPLIVFSISYFQLSKEKIMEIAQKDVYTIVKKNNEIIDAKLSRVQEMIYSFKEDPDFYEVYSNVDPENKLNVLQADTEIAAILNQYFSQSRDIYSVEVVAPYFTFGTDSSSNSQHGKNFVPPGVFMDTRLYATAQRGQGQIQWVPTYNFSEMFDVDYLEDAVYDYEYLFSAVGIINGSYYNGTYTLFDRQQKKPVLLVNFKESLFSSVYEKSTLIKGSYYFVADENGRVISHQDKTLLAKEIDIPDFEELVEKRSGIHVVAIDGEKRVICFDRSKITGWLSAVVIPPEALIYPILWNYVRDMFVIAGILIIVFIGLSFYLSRIITLPIRNMIRAMVNTGKGKFNMKFKETGSYEFKVLMKRFNDMNEKINNLIEENYKIKIREKEAEIKALNLQLDPHFMYNTLNMVNLLAVEKGESEISEIIMSMSNMMKYIAKSKEELVFFKEDFAYLKSYITIMMKRFEGSFSVEYRMDDAIMDGTIPKFILQPIVENAIVHGFKNLKRPGMLTIRGYVKEETRFFIIEDNGAGMNDEQMEIVQNPDLGHIGLQNVHQRIQIIYGKQYGVSIQSKMNRGTKVTVTLPYDTGGDMR